MEIQRAIEVLTNGVTWDDGFDWKEVDEACKMAIQSLQEQQRRQGKPEPVQCGECKYFDTPEYYGGGTKNVCRLYKRQVQLNDFCSYGERRESEDGK